MSDARWSDPREYDTRNPGDECPRVVERVMILDAVLGDPHHWWLSPESDKRGFFDVTQQTGLRPEDYPHIAFGAAPRKTIRCFPDKLPIGIEKEDTSRFVFLYLVNRRVPVDFRQFLIRHLDLFRCLHHWTVRLLVPRRFRKAVALYKAAVREELWTALDERNVRREFYGLLKAAQLPKIRLHDLRHSYATFLLAAGEHPKVVQELLGHSSVQLTLDTYSHLLPDLQLKERAAARLDGILAGPNPGQNPGQNQENLVTLNFASWNQIEAWLKRLHALKAAA